MFTHILLAAALLPLARMSPGFEYTSRYLTMRDGIRIAVDLYLPRELPPGKKLPTVLLQTRYFRAHRVAWPASMFWPGFLEPTIARYVARGYAYVVVDARGSGASFGTRTQEWSPDEVRDGAEVADWIVKQPWSNGRIGSYGVSYEGTAAEFLLSNDHPAVRAIVPRSGMYDAYTDCAFPGGVKLAPFLAFWSRVTAAEDSNRMNAVLSGVARVVYRGVKPVQGDSGELLLAEASRGHANNYNVAGAIMGLQFRDETGQVEAMSTYAKRDLIQRSGAAILSYSGWYDGALSAAAIKRFLSVRTPGSRLLLGPWSHQGENLSPFAAKLNDFDHTAEVIRYFDAYLKDDGASPEPDAPVRYYTVGEERWKNASSWPPPGTVTEQLFMSADNTLSSAKGGNQAATDSYRVDFTTGSGQETRWNNLTALDIKHSVPRDRRERDRKLLVYNGTPLAADLEVTGHPMITLFMESSEPDGAVFAYLEDVDPSGNVRYVTEGVLRLIHRRVSSAPAPYTYPAPYRTFASTDTASMRRGEVAQVEFDLLPISYLFRAGHSIRIAIAGADADHFAQISERAPTYTIYRDAAHPSHITLPVMRR